ncbi:hypothetical protein [Pseudomonas reactans]|uniref:hypothetical protein n=1 Tax=Pseudomonas reactans TaxID=117680 RepID=UPI0015A27BE8|nr:hypothetical protein [Pseudomonas reactans]NWC90352.1 hypothetical protein [Pseudomonas reactans]
MTAIQICALISIIIAAAILYWVGYRGGLTDGKNEGYEDGRSDGFAIGQDDASATYATSIDKISTRCQRLEQILHREPQDRLDLLAIAEKLKLAADTFRAVKSESQASQALALRDKALSMAARLDSFFQEDAA